MRARNEIAIFEQLNDSVPGTVAGIKEAISDLLTGESVLRQ